MTINQAPTASEVAFIAQVREGWLRSMNADNHQAVHNTDCHVVRRVDGIGDCVVDRRVLRDRVDAEERRLGNSGRGYLPLDLGA